MMGILFMKAEYKIISVVIECTWLGIAQLRTSSVKSQLIAQFRIDERNILIHYAHDHYPGNRGIYSHEIHKIGDTYYLFWLKPFLKFESCWLIVLELCNSTWHHFWAHSEGEELTSVLLVMTEEQLCFYWLDFNIVDNLCTVMGW